ncbi:hypothetical protein P4H66_15340 [Paenibacillus dokdonensis]|uniref:Uncharacterized protein n=1 Tax=Paenibacillus dokdonensis TaxID=2567944 RepID=A0ABU6GR81_9BACL|nr:hypothetical protein [Paenibacillus dokdonensis]MEC0241225.1 hypothetical protein [Paenibacillus dokdonensis]
MYKNQGREIHEKTIEIRVFSCETVVEGGYVTHLAPSQAEEYKKNLVYEETRLIPTPGYTTFDTVVAISWNFNANSYTVSGNCYAKRNQGAN